MDRLDTAHYPVASCHLNPKAETEWKWKFPGSLSEILVDFRLITASIFCLWHNVSVFQMCNEAQKYYWLNIKKKYLICSNKLLISWWKEATQFHAPLSSSLSSNHKILHGRKNRGSTPTLNDWWTDWNKNQKGLDLWSLKSISHSTSDALGTLVVQRFL